MPPTSAQRRATVHADFVDRGWPVNALLLILASCAAGAIAGRGDFETPDPWRNAWVHLGVLAGVFVMIVVTATLASKRLQRPMQLALLLCLLVHAALSVGMRHYYLSVLSPLDKPIETQEVYQPKVVPDYQVRDQTADTPTEDTPLEMFEKPVETDVAKPEKTTIVKTEAPEPEVEQPEKRDVKTQPLEPKPVELERAESSPSKRAERLTNPERSNPQLVQDPVEQVRMPQATTETRQHNEPNPAAAPERSQPMLASATPRTSDAPFENTPTVQPQPLSQPRRGEQIAPATVNAAQVSRAEPSIVADSLARPEVQQPARAMPRPSVDASRPDVGRLSTPGTAAGPQTLPRASSMDAGAAELSQSTVAVGVGPQRAASMGNPSLAAPSTGAGAVPAVSSIPRQSSGSSAADGIDVPKLASVPAASGIPGASGQGGAPGGLTGTPARRPGPASLEPGGGVASLPRPGASIPVRIAAPAGIGGLGGPPGPDVGMPSRLARTESETIHTATPRIIVEKSGGEPTLDTRVRDTAVEGLKQRDAANRGDVAKSRGGTAATERAVELGLDFLARHQSADGSWSLHRWHEGRGYSEPVPATMQSSTAGTGLALLAFLGAGYTHTDGKYRTTVGRGLDYITLHQKPEGDLFVPQDQKSNVNVWLYSHGIASIALCEAYGMTRDPALRASAQRALDFIVFAQEPSEGGWRYSPRQGSDTSVSGWQVMALKSGELAGLQVPADTYAKVTRWLDAAQGAGGNPSRYAYRPGSEFTHQREPSRVMTAEALLMRQYLGWRRDNSSMVGGAQWLHTNLPQWGPLEKDAFRSNRDAYYWYYATQVMFQMQGDYWKDWNDRLRELLVDSQEQTGGLAGSWHPLRPVPDRWGNEGGRLYVTALHLLMLEVYYRHLPIYQTLD